MMVNSSAVILNRWEKEGQAHWFSTKLFGVFWSSAEEGGYPGRQYSNKGLEEKNRAKVLVPAVAAEKEYVAPSRWQSLSEEEKEKVFTFQVGDILLFGDEVAAKEPEMLLRQREDAVCINRVHPVLAPHGLSHWELEGV